jgi:hypothetical protein
MGKINEKMGLALALKKYHIDKDNEFNSEYLKGNSDKTPIIIEKINTRRDEMERRCLLKNFSIIYGGLLANTALSETFQDMDNRQIGMLEKSRFRKNNRPMFYISSDRIYECLSERKVLLRLVYKDLCQQISDYMVINGRLPNYREIKSALIEPLDVKEFLDTLRSETLTSKKKYEQAICSENIENVISEKDRQTLTELVDVFVPADAGIDNNDTVELIAKNMVWNNRLAKIAGGIHGNIIRSFSTQPTDYVKVAEALDDVYVELMKMEITKKDDDNVTTVLDEFVSEYTEYIENGDITKSEEHIPIEKSSYKEVVMQTVENTFKKENIPMNNVTIESMYAYLASRTAERELYYGKNSSMDLLIDEVTKRQRMGIKSYKLEIAQDPNVSEDKLAVGLIINNRSGRYRAHGLANGIIDTLTKPENSNLVYYRMPKDLPVNITTIYKLSTEQQLEILHMLAERTVQQPVNADNKEIKNRSKRIKILNFYTSGIMEDITENGTPEERKQIEDITNGKSYYKLLSEEKNNPVEGEPKSYMVRKAMLNILYDRVKIERGEYTGER